MTVFLGDQAKRLYFTKDMPLGSIGVFLGPAGDYLYWYCEGHTYDTGSAETEQEALETAKRNFK